MKRSQGNPVAALEDGRVRRGARSRQTIVDALLELIGGGVPAPTAQQVADRAGVGIRTVFRHFSEMEGLYRSMDAWVEAEARPLLNVEPAKGGVEERARGLVRQRALFFERIAPYKRSGDVLRVRSPFLQERHANLQRVLRTDLLRWLPELSRSAADVAQAIELATSFEAWDRLRTDQKLGPKQAIAVVERTLLALLCPRSAKASR